MYVFALRFESLAKQEQDLAGEVAAWIPQVQKAVAGLAMESEDKDEKERGEEGGKEDANEALKSSARHKKI